MAVLVPILWSQGYRQFETSSSRFKVHLTVQTLHRVTFMPLVHLKRHYMVAGLAVVK